MKYLITIYRKLFSKQQGFVPFGTITLFSSHLNWLKVSLEQGRHSQKQRTFPFLASRLELWHPLSKPPTFFNFPDSLLYKQFLLLASGKSGTPFNSLAPESQVHMPLKMATWEYWDPCHPCRSNQWSGDAIPGEAS